MRVIHKKSLLFLYGMGAMGVNMLNLIIGSYLCDALMIEGFDTDVEYWTFADKTLVVVAVWSVLVTVAKVLDGIIDIPLATFADNLRTRWGKRRPALIIGMVPMILAYVGFLFPISSSDHSVANTVWCGVMLCIFYIFYTLTMGTYYATFSEVVDNEKDRVALSNFKTVFDIVYFVLGYALIPVFISLHVNIRWIGIMFLPLVLLMLIPVFLIKEQSNRIKDVGVSERVKGVSIIKAIKYCLTNRAFVIWMCAYSLLQFGLQLFITGENVYFSGTMNFSGIKITLMMASIFAPVPFTLLLYNFIVNKKGLKVGYTFSIVVFCVGMAILAFANPTLVSNETVRLVLGVLAGLISSFGIGCFFSISYTVPSQLAVIQRTRTGDSNPTMYFAVQGLFAGISTAIATGVVWVNLKNAELSAWMPLIALVACVCSLLISLFLPKELNVVGMRGGSDSDAAEAEGETLAEGE